MAELSPLRVIAFPGAPNLPIFAAIERSFFADAGVRVDLETTPNSRYQMEKLVGGEFDIAATAFDNVVAYQEGQGAVSFAETPDVVAFLGATQIELSFVVAPEVERYEQLKGRSLALDALATGFAFVLYHMLEKAGLGPGGYRLEAVGATPQRWESVRDGRHAGTLTIEPFTTLATSQGFRVLDTSGAHFASYQGGIFAASRRWAEAHRDELEAFENGYRKGVDWTLDPANRADAAGLLMQKMPAIKPKVVDAVLDKLVSPKTGLIPDASILDDGVRTVLELRSRYGEPRRQLNEPSKYILRF